MTYVLDPAAQQDLENYVGFIANEDVVTALDQDDRIARALQLLSESPRLGRRMRLATSTHAVRAFPIDRTPIVAFYVATVDGIVLRLFHAAQQPIAR